LQNILVIFLLEAIKHDRFESFVDIYIFCKDQKKRNYFMSTASMILNYYEGRHRILKYYLNQQSLDFDQFASNSMELNISQMELKGTNIDPNTEKCFHVLLNHPKFDVNQPNPDEYHRTALHVATTSSEFATLELLKKGASLTIQDDHGQMAIQAISNSTLKKYLDSCITKFMSYKRSDFYFMEIDYSFLKEEKEMPLIEYLTEAKDVQPLIEHPVIASFLFLKWFRLNNIFYLNLLLYSMNALTFIIFLMNFYIKQNLRDSGSYHFLLAYSSFIMLSAKEIIQCMSSPKSYIKSSENYLEILLMILMAVALMVPIETLQRRQSVAAVLVMGFAIEWTLMFSALPMFPVSNYIVMLEKVAINFLKAITCYSIILLAFALSFNTLINKPKGSTGNSTISDSNVTVEESKIKSILLTIFDVVLMLTGEYGDLSKEVEDLTIGRIFLVVFVLSMSIVMMNLLVGLTVSDTAAIEREAEWYKWWERAKLLSKYERMTWNW
jgi:transient receptor potential cation channel subfamily A member 1